MSSEEVDQRPKITTEYARVLVDFEDWLVTGYRQNDRSRLVVAGPTKAGSGPNSRSAGAGRSSAGRPSTDRRDAAQAPPEERRRRLDALSAAVADCRRCGLHSGRTRAVPGVGIIDPLVFCVGEAPGAEEDRIGEPFVGASGQFLDQWLKAIGLSRQESAFIGNVIKCRPPDNRDPEPDEVAHCRPYLEEQIALVRPHTLLALGRFAGHFLGGGGLPLGAMRGRVYDWRGIPVIVTYHPSAVLRNAELKRPVWEDLKLLRSVIDDCISS